MPPIVVLVTRDTPRGPEVLVIDRPGHARALPVAVDGADPVAVAWAATGTLGMEPGGALGRVEWCGATREAVQVHATIAMPDHWEVMSPDDGGHVARCSWIACADAPDELRDALSGAPRSPAPRPRPELPASFATSTRWEEFWAHPFFACRFVASYVDGIGPDECSRVRAIAATDAGEVVLVLDDSCLWGIPGGGREPGESPVGALRRELWEEARVHVVECEFLVAMQIARLDADGGAAAIDHHAHYWARVAPDEWRADHETTDRRILPVADALAVTAFPRHLDALLERAVRVDPRLVRR